MIGTDGANFRFFSLGYWCNSIDRHNTSVPIRKLCNITKRFKKVQTEFLHATACMIQENPACMLLIFLIP